MNLDDGYYFGLGAFETIAVEDGAAQFLEAHYARLKKTLEFLNLSVPFDCIESETERALSDPQLQEGRKVLKLAVSEKNILTSTRNNPYTRENYMQGFTTAFSSVRRNEFSPLTYHKTLNYGDCILEKRKARQSGIQEPIFLNTHGQIAEGASSNVFFLRDGKIFTPKISCGILPGVLRSHLLDVCEVCETVILPQEISTYDEMFLTNSLMGVMPVRQLGDHVFSGMNQSRQLAKMIFSSKP